MTTKEAATRTRRVPPIVRTAGARLGAVNANGNGHPSEAPRRDGPVVDATLEGIGEAERSVHELIARVRTVNDSLFGSEDGPEGGKTAAPEPSGRAYLANVRLDSLREALATLAAEVHRLERL